MAESISERLSNKSLQRRAKKVGRQALSFVRGPIPLPWISRAGQPRGKALAVALVLWHLKGLTNNDTVTLTSTAVARFGINPKAADRGLRALEEAGLVTVDRRRGRSPIVTVKTLNQN